MNYIFQINAFYDWLETNPISDSSIALWHGLMHINNKCGWKQEFAVAISSIQNKTGLSKSSILRARNNLKQCGLIEFKSRDGNQSTIYKMFAFHTDTQTGTQTGAQTGTQSEPEADTILKLNKTKMFVVIGGQEKDFDYLKNLFEQDVSLKMKWAQNGFAAEKFFEGVEQWVMQNHTEKYEDFNRARKHFYYWIPNYNLKKQKNGKHFTRQPNKVGETIEFDKA